MNNKNKFYNEEEVIKEKCPLEFKGNCLCISKISDLKIYAPKLEYAESYLFNNIIFTPIFNEMVDLLHFGISTSTPIIFEGYPGQGKHTAIDFISRLLNYDIENIIITNNITVDDLFKKTVLEFETNNELKINVIDTELNKIFQKHISLSDKELYSNKKNYKKNPTLFVFQNIEKASSDVLIKIKDIFNNKSLSLNYYFIGIINIKESSIESKDYYNIYFYNSIYYVVNSTKINISFFKQISKRNDLTLSILNYYNDKENLIFTITDLIKYITLKKCSNFEESFLETIIFKNKYYQYNIHPDKNINTTNKQEFNLNIYFQYHRLIFEINRTQISFESLNLDYFTKDINISTLSFEQKKCLIILGLAVKSKFPCILQGSSGIGKSHLIKLFAKLLGKKLYIIKLNKDNDISLFSKKIVYKYFENNEENEIKAIVDMILLEQEGLYNLTKKEKNDILNDPSLNNKKQKIFEKLIKEKYNGLNKEGSVVLKAFMNGNWLLLDGIENASPSIIEKIILLLRDYKIESDLNKGDSKLIHPREGFHLFMTYNQERNNKNKTISHRLLDKCLVYYINSFLYNEQSLSQIIFGFLVDSNRDKTYDSIFDISSEISKVHHKITNKLRTESEDISERTIIRFCKNFSFYGDEENNFLFELKNNLRYFYFPSCNMEKIDNIINDSSHDIIPFWKKNLKIAKNSSYFFFNKIVPNIILINDNNFNLGNIFYCLNIKFFNLSDIIKEIDEIINELEEYNYEGIYFPLKSFVKYLENINAFNEKKSYHILIKEAIDLSNIRILLLFEKLYINDLLSWDCINILYKNINIINTIMNLLQNPILHNLELFFEQIILNKKYILDIINIFPYSLFQKSKLKLLNDILQMVIKNAAVKTKNFTIKISNKEFNFKFTEYTNTDIIIILDINLNENNELFITKDTNISFLSKNNTKIMPIIKLEKNEQSQLNMLFLQIIEKIFKSSKVDNIIINNIYNEVINELDASIKSIRKYNFDFQIFFKNPKKRNKLIMQIWSILYLIGDCEIKYFSNYFEGIEKDIFEILIFIRNEILCELSKNFEEKLSEIISLSKDLQFILDNINILINLSKDEKYINENFKSFEDLIKTKNEIENEINIITYFIEKYNNFPIIKKLFKKYTTLLENKNFIIINAQKSLEMKDVKENIGKKIKLILNWNSKEIFGKKLNETNEIIALKNLDELINKYIINFNSKTIEEKINLFSEIKINDCNDLEKNKNTQLIEILLKYSVIRNIINEILNNKENKFKYMKQLCEINEKYINLLLPFLKENIKEKKLIYNFLDSMQIQEIIYNDLGNNLIELKKLLNNLYSIENFEKINQIWCQNIEKKYHLTTKIYLPILTEESFLCLFIKKTNIYIKKNLGYIFDIYKSNQRDEFLLIKEIHRDLLDSYFSLEKKGKAQLILDIGNILIHSLIIKKNLEDLELLCQYIKNFIIENKDNENKKIIISILQNYIKAEELYMNYNNNEPLIFDDINNKKNEKEFFTKKYPSLLVFFNCNQKIYNSLLEQPKIINFKFSDNSIPLWLICLRVFANFYNMKPKYYCNYNITVKLEKDFKEKLVKNLSVNYKNIDWILLISPNKNKFIENKVYEKIYELFNFLFYELSLLNVKNQNQFYEIIKDALFDLFYNVYEKEDFYQPSSKINLFKLGSVLLTHLKKYMNEKLKNFYNSGYMSSLKSFLNSLLNDGLNDSLNNLINKFKNDLRMNIIEENFYKMIEIGYKYNDLINIYKNMKKSKKNIENEINLLSQKIQKFINDKDAFFIKENYIILNSKIFNRVAFIPRNDYKNKYINTDRIKVIQHFKTIKFDNFFEQFILFRKKLKEINNLINSLDIYNIDKLSEINQLVEQLRIYICDFPHFKSVNDIEIKLYKLNDYILENLAYLREYQKDKDIYLIGNMIKASYIYIPIKDIFQSFHQNVSEKYIIKDEHSIIPYYSIHNNKIIGCDEIKYDLGMLSLKDSEIQSIYFASFDSHIKYEILKKNDDVSIIQKNKLYGINIKIKEKTQIDTEKINTEGVIRLYYNKIEKIIKFQINYQLEPLKLYIKCNKYKLKYVDKSTFLLNTPTLFDNEIINFTIKDLCPYLGNNADDFYISLKAYKDNKCIMPHKKRIKEGFSLKIESEYLKHFLSCLVTVYINQRFHFYIKIQSEVKSFDFEFLISKNNEDCYFEKKIYCSFEEKDDFNFTLYIKVSNNRLCYLNLKQDYNNKITSIKDTSFFNSIKIKHKIERKSLEKQESNIKIKAKIDNKIKEIDIIFTSKNERKNDIFSYINNEIIFDDNSDFFSFSFSEMTAQGMKIDEEPIIKVNENIQKNKGFANLNQINYAKIPEINVIEEKLDYSLKGINEFFNRISEQARLLPIYCLNYLNNLKDNSKKDNQKIILKNIHILEEIYNGLVFHNSQNVKFLKDNFFNDYIKDFISSFNYMKSVIEIRDRQNSNIIKHIDNDNEILNQLFNNDEIMDEDIYGLTSFKRKVYNLNKFESEKIVVKNYKRNNFEEKLYSSHSDIFDFKMISFFDIKQIMRNIFNNKYGLTYFDSYIPKHEYNEYHRHNCISEYINNSKNEKIEKYLSENLNKNDELLINYIISNIMEQKDNEELKSYSIQIQSPIFKNNLKSYIQKNNCNNYITKTLIIFAKYYMEKILELISKININYQKTSICFIIDCSSYLNIEIKLVNLLIILSIIKILYIIDIQFAIFLSADNNYKIVLKNYDDDYILYEDLIEILYETIIIQRSRNNILKTLKTCIDYLKNKERNTIYIEFFDCMDESFTYVNYWLNNILNDKTNSFMLIVEKSMLYKEENKDIINNMMKSFNEKVKKNSFSKIKIMELNFTKENIDLEIIFSEIFNFFDDITELKETNKTIKRIDNINNNDNLKSHIKSIKFFESIVNDNIYGKFDKIYFKNNKNIDYNINLPEKLNNGVNLTLPEYDQKDFLNNNNNFFMKIIKNSSQNDNLIDYIFYPNKYIHKTSSTRGSELDIMKLIFYPLQPVSPSMLYFENEDNLIKDYSLTIIIDNSKSCFSEFNERHSFLTIINLLQIINSIEISSLDLILTSNDEPNILIYNKQSNFIFQNYSIIENLFISLSNPVINTNMSNAIEAVYELKKRKKLNDTNYLFILTDGLSCIYNQQNIKYFCLLCQKIGIKIFSIGLGIFPYKTQNFFDSFIFSENPDNLLKALSLIFGKKIKTETELKLVSNSRKERNLNKIFNEIKNNKIFYFDELILELIKIEQGEDRYNFENYALQKEIKKYLFRIKNQNDKENYGFFVKLPFPDMNNLKPFLLIDSNSLNQNDLEKEKIEIIFEYNNEKLQINLNDSIKYQNYAYNIFIIEIKIDIQKFNFLELDEKLIESLIKEHQNLKNLQEKVCTLKYINGKILFLIQNLSEKNEKEVLYSNNNILSENNIFPIINLKNNKLTGINSRNNNNIDLICLFDDLIEVKYYIENALKEFNLKKNIKLKGEGGFGKVFLIEYKKKKYALKKISLKNLDKKDIISMKEILNVLLNLNNEYIVKYYYYFIEQEYFNVVMEYAGDSDLKEFIQMHNDNCELIEENIIVDFMKQIYLGLKEIKKINIVHRDLKPENIIIGEKNKIKIVDFGISKCIKKNKNDLSTVDKKGTPYYVAPEILKGKYDGKADLYSFGCIIYELFTLNKYYLDFIMADEEEKKNAKINETYNKKWQELIDKLVIKDKDRRPDLEEISDYFS